MIPYTLHSKWKLWNQKRKRTKNKSLASSYVKAKFYFGHYSCHQSKNCRRLQVRINILSGDKHIQVIDILIRVFLLRQVAIGASLHKFSIWEQICRRRRAHTVQPRLFMYSRCLIPYECCVHLKTPKAIWNSKHQLHLRNNTIFHKGLLWVSPSHRLPGFLIPLGESESSAAVL